MNTSAKIYLCILVITTTKMMVRILILAAKMAEMAVAVGKCTLPLLLDFSDFMHGSSLRK